MDRKYNFKDPVVGLTQVRNKKDRMKKQLAKKEADIKKLDQREKYYQEKIQKKFNDAAQPTTESTATPTTVSEPVTENPNG